jgi:hypothetical protein
MNKSYVIAFIFAVAVAGWIASGQLGGLNEPAEASVHAPSDGAEAIA